MRAQVSWWCQCSRWPVSSTISVRPFRTRSPPDARTGPGTASLRSLLAPRLQLSSGSHRIASILMALCRDFSLTLLLIFVRSRNRTFSTLSSPSLTFTCPPLLPVLFYSVIRSHSDFTHPLLLYTSYARSKACNYKRSTTYSLFPRCFPLT